MNHQQVTGILNAAGFVSHFRTRTIRRQGYSAVQVGSAVVGVICGVYPVEQVTAALINAGLRVYQKPNASRDALFVGAA